MNKQPHRVFSPPLVILPLLISQINSYHEGLCFHGNSVSNSNHSVNEINCGGKLWGFAFVFFKTKNGISHDTSINLMTEPGKLARSFEREYCCTQA